MQANVAPIDGNGGDSRMTKLFPVYGYADETLMKDMRFKLGHALRNAGLNGTDYAGSAAKGGRQRRAGRTRSSPIGSSAMTNES